MFFRSRHLSSQRIGCRLLGCACIVLVLLLFLCGLATLGVIVLTQRAHAQSPLPQAQAVEPTPQLLILVDQSGSVTSFVTTKRLAQQSVQSALTAWPTINPTAIARLDFFGSEVISAAGPSLVTNSKWSDLISNAFAKVPDLGATEFDRALSPSLNATEVISDVVLITDGIPDPIGRSDDAGRRAYADLLRQMGNRLAERGTRLSVVLIGDVNRGTWGAVWQELANQTGGVFVEARTLADVSAVDRAWVALVPVIAATAIPSPTKTPTVLPTPSPSPTPTITKTRAPTQTAVATQMPTSVRIAQPQVLTIPTPAPEPTSTQKPYTPDPPGVSIPSTPLAPTPPTTLIGLSVLVLLLISVGLVFALRSRSVHQQRLRQITAVPPADEGYIEVDADADVEAVDDVGDEATQRIELRSRVMGEVLSIGYDPGCDIHLPNTAYDTSLTKQENEQAVLILTPHGPVIEARSGRLEMEGRAVRQHLLFDGDTLTLNRCLLSYRNFFRQRPISETDVETEIDN